MIRIAHRGSMTRGLQNTPEGIRLALAAGIDWGELDGFRARDGAFRRGHGPGRGSALDDCLAAMDGGAGLIVHVKGPFSDDDLTRLAAILARHIPPLEIVFAGHRGAVLRRLHTLAPGARLGRFGLLPALAALWRPPVWQIALVNQAVLFPALLRALRSRGLAVHASCVWELRSRDAIARLRPDAAFVNPRS